MIGYKYCKQQKSGVVVHIATIVEHILVDKKDIEKLDRFRIVQLVCVLETRSTLTSTCVIPTLELHQTCPSFLLKF